MLAPAPSVQSVSIEKRATAYSRLFECVVAASGFTAAIMACLTLLLGVLFVGASLDMLADPSPMLAFSRQQSEALRWANVTSLLGFGALLLPVVFFVAAR